MKILIMSREFPPDVGGIGSYAYELARATAQNGHEVTIITKAEKKRKLISLPQNMKIVEIPHFSNNSILKKFSTFLFGALYLYKENKNNKLDIIHLIDPSFHLVGYIVSLFQPINYITTSHGSEIIRFGSKNSIKYLMKKVYKKSKKIIAVSSYTSSLLLKHFSISNDNVSVIPCGVPRDVFINTPLQGIELRKEIGIKNTDFVLLTIARLDPRKGHDKVIEAIHKLKDKYPNIKYVIGGSGNDRGRLVKLVQDYHLEEYVIFAGFISDAEIIKYYDMCDVFIMPNRQDKFNVEGFGISFIEASSRYKPVIANNEGGAKDAVENNKSGLLVSKNNRTELKNAIEYFIKNPDKKNEFGFYSRHRVEKSFTWDIISRRIYGS